MFHVVVFDVGREHHSVWLPRMLFPLPSSSLVAAMTRPVLKMAPKVGDCCCCCCYCLPAHSPHPAPATEAKGNASPPAPDWPGTVPRGCLEPSRRLIFDFPRRLLVTCDCSRDDGGGGSEHRHRALTAAARLRLPLPTQVVLRGRTCCAHAGA